MTSQKVINNTDIIPQIRFMNIEGIDPAIKNKKWKIPDLNDELQLEKQSGKKYTPFLAFTESHINSDILDAEIHLQDYSIYRSDRIRRKMGGAIIYSHKDITIDDSEDYTDEYCSVIMVYSKQFYYVPATDLHMH